MCYTCFISNVNDYMFYVSFRLSDNFLFPFDLGGGIHSTERHSSSTECSILLFCYSCVCVCMQLLTECECSRLESWCEFVTQRRMMSSRPSGWALVTPTPVVNHRWTSGVVAVMEDGEKIQPERWLHVCFCNVVVVDVLTCNLLLLFESLSLSLSVLTSLPSRGWDRQRCHLTNTDSLLVAPSSAASALDWPVAAADYPPPCAIGPPFPKGPADPSSSLMTDSLVATQATEFRPTSCTVEPPTATPTYIHLAPRAEGSLAAGRPPYAAPASTSWAVNWFPFTTASANESPRAANPVAARWAATTTTWAT